MNSLLATRLLRRTVLSTLSACKRQTSFDQSALKIGEREIVGYGCNGSPIYFDRADFPFPSIRFKESTPEICKLRTKEEGDWNKMSLDEKKCLYRYSFCQTFAEFKAPTADWKFTLGIGLWGIVAGIWLSILCAMFLYGPLPDTFAEHRREAQLKRMITMEVNPIDGIASKWDYENNRWKK